MKERKNKPTQMNGPYGWFEYLYGYRSRNRFLKSTGVRPDVFERMARDEWWFQKSALLHPECPEHIRVWFLSDPVWFKRFVAYFATKAPKSFWERAVNETDKRIKRAYDGRREWAEEQTA
jgi:hypothetical protein